ncbi:putative peptidase [Planktothrix sp. PCC 11201]|uniref:M23 family metallopeptidase n=1 Tax=Planktothrix sp. PCC 11201 TaxID=1729650 RepID=UPI00091E1D54|nr:M23 family metallopeptidase [Planktothrix sp. PCC 11201]SKB11149.1 putative peptidase [Planktothrix sp. PCC 11201]
MTEQKKYPTSNTRQGRWYLGSRSYALLGLGCLTGLVLFSSRVIATDEFSIPVEAEPVEASVPSVPEATTGYSDSLTVPNTEPEPTHSEPQAVPDYATPDPSYSEPAYNPEPEYYSEPNPPEIPNIVPPPEQEIVFPDTPPAAESPANAYIDPTDYKIGATDGYEAPSTVVFSERSTGCEASLALGQAAGDLCSPSPVYPSSIYQAENNQVPYIGNNNLGSVPNPLLDGGNFAPTQPNSSYSNGFVANSPDYGGGGYEANYTYTSQPEAVDYGSGGSYSGEVAVTGFSPIQVGPMMVSSMSNSGLTYYNRTQRPAAVRGNGNTSVLFPLTIPSPITSLFGWREHPVLGYGRFHTGIDLGADEGTPVVASYSGQVSVADWLGGYGMAVVLNHSEKSQETLYGHLSELFVKPGELVQQGEVIGRVGSTGVSTGPHLHFELRKLTSQGWVAIDPRNDIEVALAQLLNTMKVAQVPSSEFIAKLTEDVETGMPKLPPLPPGVDVMIPNLEPPTLNFGFAENLKSPG